MKFQILVLWLIVLNAILKYMSETIKNHFSAKMKTGVRVINTRMLASFVVGLTISDTI